MPVPSRHRAALLWALLAFSGCAWLGPPPPPLSDEPLELSDTPFFPQQVHHCGPAALATVLAADGVDANPERLASAVYLPRREGSLQVELMAAARRHGRLAVVLPGTSAAIVAALRAGRPVLVLQNLASTLAPAWHYAVVVGYRPDDGRFVLRSGTERRLTTSRGRFEATWRRAGNWAVVVLAPEADPSGLDADAYLRAAADLENTGDHRRALTAFRSAVAAWPASALARLGEANNLYYLGRQAEAADAYAALIEQHPDHPVAVHNLAMLLLEMAQPCRARRVIEAAAGLDGALMDTARRSVADAAGACAAEGASEPIR